MRTHRVRPKPPLGYFTFAPKSLGLLTNHYVTWEITVNNASDSRITKYQYSLDRIKNYTTEQKLDDMNIAPETAVMDYQLYLEMANGPSHPFGNDILNFDDFVAINYIEHLVKLDFLPPTASVLAGLQGISTVRQYLSAARSAKSDLAAAVNEIQSFAEEARSSGSKFMDVMGKPGDDGTRGGPPYRDGIGDDFHHFDTSKLNVNTRPIEVRLNTGLEPNCYGATFLNAKSGFSPLHLTQTKLSFLSLATGADPKTYLENALIPCFQNLAQRAASFNINAGVNFSIGNLEAYFDALTVGLSYYYWYASVISYCDDGPIRNEGMYKLRTMMSADDLNNLHMLKKVLEGCPIPPNLNHLIFWMSQTYSISPLPGSALIKLMPFGFASTTDTNYKFSALPGLIGSALNSLINGQIRDTAMLMARVCPGWTSESLGSPSEKALHDPGFTTLFVNMYNSSVNTSGAGFRFPNVSGNESSILYASHTNDLDGAIQGLLPIYNTSLSAWFPSLLDTSVSSVYATTRYTNRLSYCLLSDGTSAFVPIVGYGDISISRQETNLAIGGSAYTLNGFGAEYILNININSVRETAQNLLEWLLSFNTIGSGVKALKSQDLPNVRHVNEVGTKRTGKQRNYKSKKK